VWIKILIGNRCLVQPDETGTNVTRTTKKTPMTTFMKGEEWRLFLSFLFKSDNFSDFLTLQDKHKICTLSLSIKFICTRCETGQRHSSPFINVVKGVFFVVRVTLVPVSCLSAPSAVHSYRVPGKFIRRLKSLFVGWKVYSSSLQIKLIATYLTEILLKVALSTITLTLTLQIYIFILQSVHLLYKYD
jgi:hypothetical protein